VLADRWSYGHRPRLHSMDLRPVVAELQSQTRPRYWQVILKRFMFRLADRLARELGHTALVTGEAVGQVSSQTLQNLAVISEVTSLPVLRPLIGFNKEEIVHRARLIGTFELSSRVPEYCALEARPDTHASSREVALDEARIDGAHLAAAFAQREEVDLRSYDPHVLEEVPAPEIDHIPPGATVVDLRSRLAFDSWHYPEAVRLDYPAALARCGSLDRRRTYVVCCEVEFKSVILVEKLRQEGIDAYHFSGGMKALMDHAIEKGLTSRALISPVLLGD
jgi:thiamine biosynthesis protein ThiI